MGSYRDIKGELRGKTNAQLLILDTNNIQFYFQHSGLLPQAEIFQPYDMVFIPGWVHAELAHHVGKSAYVASIPSPVFFVEEAEDYLPMIGYSDKRLMELFRLSAPFQESQRFFSHYRNVEADDLPDDWIDLYYQSGFFTRPAPPGSLVTRKNAGEVSILTLTFLLLSHYPNEIANISIATSDFGLISIKNKLLRDATKPPLQLIISPSSPISFLSTDVTIFNAINSGLIQPQDILDIRPNPKSSIIIKHFTDGTSALYEAVIDTPSFVEICKNTAQYTILF